MPDQEHQPEPHEPVSPADDLARAYGAALGEPAWTEDAPAGVSPELEPRPGVDPEAPPPLLRIVEALLFVGGEPLTVEHATGAVRGITAQQFTQAVDSLNKAYRQQGRPYAVRPQGQGYVLALRPGHQDVIERLSGQNKEARLSTAAVDVLSLVAYRQPVTKQEVDAVRGAESGALLRQLVRRGLVAISRAPGGGREVAYSTTPRFLELFKLTSLDDLPQTQDLQTL